MKHILTGRALLIALALAAVAVEAQPLPKEVSRVGLSRDVRLNVDDGTTIWSVPGPHGLEWIIAYDDTPLTFDNPSFQIRLVNNASAVEAIRADENLLPMVVIELTKPDGQVVRTKPVPGLCSLYHSGRGSGKINKGKPVFSLNARLDQLLGELEPGVHTLVMHIDTVAKLQRADDGHIITESLSVSTPILRFEVIERDIPELDPADEFLLDENPVRLTNPFDEPITFSARSAPRDPDWPSLDRYFGINTAEKLTESGWIDLDTPGYCGMGVGPITIPPGKTVALRLNRIRISTQGVLRYCILATRPDGTEVRFYSKAKRVE